jgi:hypothetical protein
MHRTAMVALAVMVAISFHPRASLAGDGGIPARIAALEKEVASLKTQLAAVQSNKALLLGSYVTVDPNAENGVAGPNIVFTGANIHIVDGSGATDDHGGTALGLGNLVIGYDENDLNFSRTGSHNLVAGTNNGFSSIGGFVAGRSNRIAGVFASVSGGSDNVAGGFAASVSGGRTNAASQQFASVSGGSGNTASGFVASVSGGSGNTASEPAASVSGGGSNTAGGFHSSVSGGRNNNASGDFSAILGGNGIMVSTTDGTSPLTP